jgi:FK506-binding nuclear protein
MLISKQNYQQPLDITIGEGERVYFKVSGTHTIYLTGNYVIPVDDSPREMYDDGEDDEYDLSPDEDELDDGEESDELDDMDDPRITEVDSDEEEAPKLVKADKKGKNKRAAEESDEEAVGLDEIMTKSLKPEINGETKLSKKQQKKLKNNAGEAVPAAAKKDAESPASKKVQFAKNLEQGPTGTKADAKTADKKPEAAKAAEKGKAALGVKTVNGVKIDDKKLGSGPAAKKGNRVGMRYIGKLDDGKVFDCKDQLILAYVVLY